MGSLTLAYPSIAGKTTQEQLESMRRYLCSVTEQLNLADWSAKATLTEISQAIDADSLSEAEKKTTLSGYRSLLCSFLSVTLKVSITPQVTGVTLSSSRSRPLRRCSVSPGFISVRCFIWYSFLQRNGARLPR